VVFSANNDHFSPLCLRYFQGNVSMQPYQSALIEVDNGHASDDPSLSEDLFGEGNLDMQYIMAMSPGSPTTYWHYSEGIGRFIRDLAGKPKPSLVVSISYGLSEMYMSAGEYRMYDEWVLKASAMGVTVFTASGDQGANGGGIDGVASRCKYEPSYPSSSPYTVSVGGTSVSAFFVGHRNAFYMFLHELTTALPLAHRELSGTPKKLYARGITAIT
jgi:subtilisin family serine protease